MKNPFDLIDVRLNNIETLLLDIKHTPKEDLSNKRYSIKESSKNFDTYGLSRIIISVFCTNNSTK